MHILQRRWGIFDCAIELLEEIGFPEELIANTSVEKFLKLIGREG